MVNNLLDETKVTSGDDTCQNWRLSCDFLKSELGNTARALIFKINELRNKIIENMQRFVALRLR